MFVALRRITVTEGNADKIVEKFSAPGVIEEQDGFIDLTVMKQKAIYGEEEVAVMIRWESEEHWKKWEKSDAHVAGHKAQKGKPKPEYIIRQEGGRYEVQTVKNAMNEGK